MRMQCDNAEIIMQNAEISETISVFCIIYG